ncbi:oligosaccharide flippase family protein, partial [candidate division KSB1 bacterium]
MSQLKSVINNSTILLAGSIINRLFEIICILLLTYYLDFSVFGYYRTIFAYFALWALVIDLGVYGIVLREGSRNREMADDYLANSYAIGTITIIGVIGASYVTLNYLTDFPNEVKNLYWYGVLSIVASSRFKSFRKLFEILFYIDLKASYPALFNILDRLLFMGCLYIFVSQSHSLSQAVLFAALVDFVGYFLLLSVYIKKYGKPRLRFNINRWKFLLSESWPTFLSAFVNVLNIKISQLIATALVTDTALTTLSFASLIAESLGFIPVAITIPAFTILSQKYVRNPDVFFNLFRIMIKYLLLFVIPIVVFIYFEIDEIMALGVSLFLNESYLQSVPVAKILIFSQIFLFVLTGLNVALISSNNQKQSLIIFSITAISNIVLNIFLIPRYGI